MTAISAMVVAFVCVVGFWTNLLMYRYLKQARRDTDKALQNVTDLRKTEALFRFLLRNLPNTTVCLFDQEKRHIVADGALISQTIPPGTKVEGAKLVDVFPRDMVAILLPLYNDTLNGRPSQTEQHFRTRTYRTTLLPIRSETGTVEMGMIVFQDVSEERSVVVALRDRTYDLERSNRDLEQFANVASHELKSPLRRIASFAGLLGSEFPGDLGDEGKEYLKHIIEGAEALQSVIEALLTYSRVQAEPARARVTPVDMQEVVRESARNLGWLIHERHVRITAAKLPKVQGDRVLIRQLVENLIGNAIKFNTTQRRPRILISAKRDLLYWEFRVTDNGPGIDPTLKDKVFVMFQRFHPEIEGKGIGLALCKKIVGIHRGKIWFESTPGQGTTFVFTLPAQAERDV